ncbi:MAG TPA: sigma-54 dependent transcriptional regulator [Dissulfurispiraceae bacterium]|nr:sigma-54 dependent transcriptional regulator [Dissulfurispiraceae bacterium]
MLQKRCLLIEDDLVDQMAFRRLMDTRNAEYRYEVTGSVSDARRILGTDTFDVVIADYLLGDGTAFDILGLNLEAPVIVITGAGSEEIAVQAMKAGAYDYLIKDVRRNYLKVLPVTMEKAIRQQKVEEQVKILSDRASVETTIIGTSKGLAETSQLVELASSSSVPVLVTGETGTGKNLVAKSIHYRGADRLAPFVSINCACLPETLIEAELFGYEQGAFTGATGPKKGLFELADGGTVFLDEIGDMPVNLQARLLSVIEDRTLRRLGSVSNRPFSGRIIASTNVDLGNVLGQTFRKDLYYRLSVIRIHLPPLRERRQDIPDLCSHLLKVLTGNRNVQVSGEELARLAAYDWPGNVRELKNVLERAVLLHRGGDLHPSDFILQGGHRPPFAATTALPPSEEELVTIEELENRYIKFALEKFSGSITRTAQALGISVSTVKRWMKSHGSK